MNEALFDIVDENNHPTGVAKPRSVVHAEETDWHRTTHIWILNNRGEGLCQQRSLHILQADFISPHGKISTAVVHGGELLMQS